ncbi:MarR family winged helix-turn-helix transcriptional regulator [Pontivivens ytuae]|uniref:MarR family transcriptional regulator n=1 Tax=Pontivivens ytuae TaxID=2789856 RepID=A0A7S9LSP3_9RHOB|nr:MarR family transcriptional regulator [Pontivivens ytuae]QPH54584.1 MarR family transcriptional regulator [Pontivivens ytuae]
MSYDLHASLGYQLSRLARAVERGFEARLEPLELTRLQWCVLLGVGQEGIGQPSGLSDFIGVDRAAISRALNVLEGQGRVVRTASNGDGRARDVAITAAGRAVLDEAVAAARANAEDMTRDLDPCSRDRLLALLTELNAARPGPLKGL